MRMLGLGRALALGLLTMLVVAATPARAADTGQILSQFWPGSMYQLSGGDCASLRWDVANVAPKPTCVEIAAREAETDAVLAALEQKTADQDRFAGELGPDALLRAVEVLTFTVQRQRQLIADMEATVNLMRLRLRNTAYVTVPDYTAWDARQPISYQFFNELRAALARVRAQQGG